ncbi:MAG TPA: tRNA pseudouridine(13) synthase TruD [Candidatus Paceibacterota bacterium]
MTDSNTRSELREKELNILKKVAALNPSLFEQQTFYESPEILRNYGIHIENKENFPSGYLKFLPQDFIVEEISRDKTIETIDNADNDLKITDGDQTVYATLVKCGVSTIEALEEMVSLLGCEMNQIQYAGIKDKDAITAQKISFRKIPAEKIRSISSPNFFLKNIQGGKGVMEKGGITGNKFTILIRLDYDKVNKTTIDAFIKQLDWLKKHGFYNFYYLQRFGTPRLINIKWGLDILRGNYQGAVKSFIGESGEREWLYFRKLRKEADISFGKWDEVIKLMTDFPLMLRNELKVLNYLAKKPGDFSGALATIPEQITLWVYAVSSLLFNEKISQSVQLGRNLPKELPLILSNQTEDLNLYSDSLEEIGLSQQSFKNLRPFPFIRPERRLVSTIEPVEIHKTEITKQGVVISFSLSKGDYATTFLAHLFNLISGKPPEWLDTEIIDLKKTLGENDIQETINKFEKVIHSKNNTILTV